MRFCFYCCSPARQGAQLENSVALHQAAGACSKDASLHSGDVSPTPEFDTDRIPLMELQVQNGADENV